MKIQNQWDKLREDYLSWVSKTKLRNFFSKNLLIDGFSIWWITSSCNRNNVLNNKWYFNLKNTYIEKKIKKISLFYIIKFYIFFFINLFKNFFKDIFFVILIKIFFYKRIKKANITNCFYSLHFNFLDKSRDYKFYDRCYGLSPLLDRKRNLNIYLINISKFTEFFRSLFTYKKKFENTGLEYYVSNAYCSIGEICRIYLIIFFHFIKLLIFLKNNNPFVIKKIDCSSVLKYHLLKSFSGEIQSYLIDSSSLYSFLKENNVKKFITYGEFNPGFRSIYHKVKMLKKRPKIIAIQHGYSNKNILFHNYKNNEFTKKTKLEGKLYSPTPDYYFVQGKHYYNLLSKYFPNKIKIVGSLKYDIFNFQPINSKKENKKIKKILVCPSIGDESYLIDFIENFQLKGFKFLISPHPTVYNETLSIFKNRVSHLVEFDTSGKKTHELIKQSDLILAGFSVTAIEAVIMGKPAVRLISNDNPIFFDPNDGLISINSKEKINFSEKKIYNYYNNKKVNKIKKNLFFKLDNSSYKRLWKNLSEIR